MKDAYCEFMINVSRQGNNVKIKLHLKINLQRLQSLFFVKITNDNTLEKQPPEVHCKNRCS